MFNVWALAWLSFSWWTLDLSLVVWLSLQLVHLTFVLYENLILLSWICFFTILTVPCSLCLLQVIYELSAHCLYKIISTSDTILQLTSDSWLFIGTLQVIFPKWWCKQSNSFETHSSWRSSSLPPGIFGSREITSSSTEDAPPLFLGKPLFTRKPNFKPLYLVKKNDMLFSSV